ncbi:uncharacterized protein LOC119652705 [Hermetia illucens]|uniref:uncharacterized protein LOC119652705 n=1 Tax=Hermetia illucens TaxID=343691 RepID=UPI0018CC2317|nr:uncharacterized protein LOC119652705 [Hermetia illucens]
MFGSSSKFLAIVLILLIPTFVPNKSISSAALLTVNPDVFTIKKAVENRTSFCSKGCFLLRRASAEELTRKFVRSAAHGLKKIDGGAQPILESCLKIYLLWVAISCIILCV